MDFKLAISLLTIGVLSGVLCLWYGIKTITKTRKYSKVLIENIMAKVDVNSSLDSRRSCFTVDAQANNAGPNHCDVVFKSDLDLLDKRKYDSDFISIPAKECV